MTDKETGNNLLLIIFVAFGFASFVILIAFKDNFMNCPKGFNQKLVCDEFSSNQNLTDYCFEYPCESGQYYVECQELRYVCVRDDGK